MSDPAEPESTPPHDAPRVLQLCAVDFTVRQFLVPLARGLEAQGCEVFVGCKPGEWWQELQSMGLRMVELPTARSANVVAHAVSVVRVARFLRRNRIDILHVHTPIAALVGRLAAAFARTPVVFYTAHGFYFHDRMPRWKYRLHAMLERLAARAHDHLFCVSEEDAHAAERLGIEKPERITVIRNGVDPDRYRRLAHEARRAELRAELGIPQDAPVALLVGRMTREKGFVEFLEAARLVRRDVPDAHFVVVGGTLPSERDRIRREVATLAGHPDLVGHAHVLGMRSDVPQLLAASDVFCLPSHREGMPVSIIEAMMLELPVVATDIRGCREEVEDGTTGFLVPVGNAADLAGAIGFLMRHRDLAKRMGIAGKRRAEEYFTLRPHLARQFDVYERFLTRRAR